MPARLPALCLILVLMGVLAGCRRYQVVETYGVFSVTRHMVADQLDWEGGNTSMESATLCSTADGTCVDADDFIISQPVERTRVHHRIAVYRRNGSGKDIERTLAFHDAATGNRLRCHGCDAGFEARIAGRDPVRDQWGQFSWGPTGATGVAAFAHGADRTRLVLLEFAADGYRAVPLADVPESAFDPGSLSIAPDDAGVGWYVCDPLCTLFAFDRERRTLLATDVPCEYNSYLDIGWLGGRGYAQHYWGASERNMCFAADGRPALPRGDGPKWTPSRDDDPARPTSVEQLPPARDARSTG